MHNIKKWPNILKIFAVFPVQDFWSIFGHFSALRMNRLRIFNNRKINDIYYFQVIQRKVTQIMKQKLSL